MAKVEIKQWRTERKPRPKKIRPAREPVPNTSRAVTNGLIATIHNGKRIVRKYRSGQPLVGILPQDDAPPFTGFVRGFGERRGAV